MSMQMMRNVIHGAFEVPIMTRVLGIRSSMKMLVLGCGNGIALPSLIKLCNPQAITGIDIDGGLLSEAKKRIGAKGIDAELVMADVRDMPFLDQSFDVVVDFGVCYHVARPIDALKEIARVLNSSGAFAHETPLAQLLSHPLNFAGRLPWEEQSLLVAARTAALWAIRTKRQSRTP